jgi:hypothetical protein
MLKAADVLYRNDMAHDDIVKYLEERKIKGGDTARELEPFFADMAIDTLSVDNNSPFKGRP